MPDVRNETVRPGKALLFALLALALMSCAALYWSGLTTGFTFDDIPAIVLNDRLIPTDGSSLEQWLGAAYSYRQAGPSGRPIAMLSFAVGAYFHGKSAHWFALENLILHLVNGILVFVLLRKLFAIRSFTGTDSSYQERVLFSLVITAWWLLHPMDVNSVLYIVQRMTALATFFVLATLVAYLHLRATAPPAGRSAVPWLRIAFVVLAGTLLSYWSKEIGLLLPVYVWLLELCAFSSHRPFDTYSAPVRRMLLGLPILAALAISIWLAAHPAWLFDTAPTRSFSPFERLLTETRVMSFYMKQIAIPDYGQFSLYHDDFTLSRSLFSPASTWVNALFHMSVLAGALVLFRKARPISFGIFFFYAGHLLESTAFPLEIAQEQRNYLPLLGILIAFVWSLRLVAMRAKLLKIPLAALAGLLFLAHGYTTYARAELIGQPLEYALFEANNHPDSVRASYQASIIFIEGIRRNPSTPWPLYRVADGFLRRTTVSHPNALPLFYARMALEASVGRRLPIETLQAFSSSLASSAPPAAITNLFNAILAYRRIYSSLISTEEVTTLFEAALSNPQLPVSSHVVLLQIEGMFLMREAGDPGRALAVFQRARTLAPENVTAHLLLAEAQMRTGETQDAQASLRQASRFDRLGLYRSQVNALSAQLQH